MATAAQNASAAPVDRVHTAISPLRASLKGQAYHRWGAQRRRRSGFAAGAARKNVLETAAAQTVAAVDDTFLISNLRI